MILFGHIGPSLLVGKMLTPKAKFTDKAFALIVFWAVFPDLIDKPLFKFGLAPQLTGRLWMHTLVGSFLACMLCRYYLKSNWPWVLAMPGHLLLDAMWTRPHTLFWPFLGNYFDPAPVPPHIVHAGYLAIFKWKYLNKPFFKLDLAMELIGLVLTLYLAGTIIMRKKP